MTEPVFGAKHGTPSGYGYWRCRCDECRAANARRARDLRRRNYDARIMMGGYLYSPNVNSHGTLSAYINFGCRCLPCRKAYRNYYH